MAYRNTELDFPCRTGLQHNLPKQPVTPGSAKVILVLSGTAGVSQYLATPDPQCYKDG